MLDKPQDNGAPSAEPDRLVLGIHERNPQDLLGSMTRTNLPRNVFLAALLTFAGMGLLSAGPYFYKLAAARVDKSADKAAAPEPAPSSTAQPAARQPAPEATRTNPDLLDKQAVPDSLAVKPPKGPDPLEKLGVSETKTTDPKKNPLDKGTDDLLKDIK